MANDLSPTKKEQIVIKYLVRTYSLDELNKDLEENGPYGWSKLAEAVIKGLALKIKGSYRGSKEEMIGLQCLYYAITNYEKVKDNNFNSQIERANRYNIRRYFEESQIVYVSYDTSFYSIPSLFQETLERVKDNFWDLDTDRDILDYSDTDVVEEDYKKPDIDLIGPMEDGTIN